LQRLLILTIDFAFVIDTTEAPFRDTQELRSVSQLLDTNHNNIMTIHLTHTLSQPRHVSTLFQPRHVSTVDRLSRLLPVLLIPQLLEQCLVHGKLLQEVSLHLVASSSHQYETMERSS
jgi:hypothetical protein